MGYRIGHSEPPDYQPGDFEKDERERKARQKPRVVTDIYKSNVVTGESMKVVPRTVPHGSPSRPVNQYGASRILTGRKGKK